MRRPACGTPLPPPALRLAASSATRCRPPPLRASWLLCFALEMSARVLAGGHVELRACVARSTQAPPHELLLALRLRGGAKSKPSRPRSWKEQSTHHAAVRKHSIRVRRGKNEQAATYTKEARDNLRRVHAARRLREIEETEKRMERLKEERASDFNHQLRLEYMRANEEADRRHNEKYQTLEDYSDSVERQLEELRQKRGESRGLTVPEWRDGGHTNFWREVDKEVADEVDDLENPSKVCVCVFPFVPLVLIRGHLHVSSCSCASSCACACL